MQQADSIQKRSAPEEISTWSGDNNVRIGSKLSKLSFHGVPPHQNGSAQICVPTQLFDDLVGLQGKLPGWG